jgi:hypothetical protein
MSYILCLSLGKHGGHDGNSIIFHFLSFSCMCFKLKILEGCQAE